MVPQSYKDNGKAHCPSAETAAYSDAVKELSWDVSQDRRSRKKTTVPIFS